MTGGAAVKVAGVGGAEWLALRTPYQPARNEHADQAAFFAWSAYQEARHPELGRLLFAVPNGGRRDKATAGKLKAEGVKAGTPDVLLLAPACHYAGLALEFKKQGGRLEPEQRAFLEAAAAAGYLCAVTWAWEAGRDLVAAYLSRNPARLSALLESWAP